VLKKSAGGGWHQMLVLSPPKKMKIQENFQAGNGTNFKSFGGCIFVIQSQDSVPEHGTLGDDIHHF
jgi:hypothetical protein